MAVAVKMLVCTAASNASADTDNSSLCSADCKRNMPAVKQPPKPEFLQLGRGNTTADSLIKASSCATHMLRKTQHGQQCTRWRASQTHATLLRELGSQITRRVLGYRMSKGTQLVPAQLKLCRLSCCCSSTINTRVMSRNLKAASTMHS
jgi:hypothetical protein